MQKLLDMCTLLRRPEVAYLATNPDWVCPVEGGNFIPDCGAMCQMLEHAVHRLPRVIGKPEPLMPQLAMERLGISRSEACCIGDRIYTDIRSGLNAGITTMLVLSGETTREILDASDVKPHFVLEDAGEILEALR